MIHSFIHKVYSIGGNPSGFQPMRKFFLRPTCLGCSSGWVVSPIYIYIYHHPRLSKMLKLKFIVISLIFPCGGSFFNHCGAFSLSPFLFLRWGFPSPSIYVFLFVFIVKEAIMRLCISILVEMDEGSSLGFYLIYEGFSALYTVSPCCRFLGLLLIWLYYCSSWGGANWIGTSKELCTLPHACPHPQVQFYIPYSYYAQFSFI